MYRIITILFGFILISCCPCRHLTTHNADSVAVEVIERTIYEVDTVEVAIPYINEERATRDTMSHLENDFAMSDAMISEGVLCHSLQTRPQLRKIEFKKPIIHRDSVVYQQSFRTVKVEVEVVKPDTWLEKTQKIGFWSMLAIFLLGFFVRRISRGGL